MATYSNTNSGVLFKEQNKKSETHPDYRGKIHVEDDAYWLSGWVSERDGKKLMKLSVSPQEGGPQNEGTGFLEPNPNKASDRHPDHKGSVTIGGQMLGIAAWKRTSNDGEKQFLSIKVDAAQRGQATQEKRQPVAAGKSEYVPPQDDDDDIPF